MRMAKTKHRVKRAKASVPNSQPAKRQAVNLTIRADVLRAAKARGINASQAAEQALIELLRRDAAATWLEENREAIEEQWERVRRIGLFNDSFRRF